MKNIIRFLLIMMFMACFSAGQNISINDVSVRFCDNTDNLKKRVSLYSEAGKTVDECVMIINNSENEGYIDLHFVSQIKTNQGEKACALPGNPDDIFVKYLKPSRSGVIYLDANSRIEKHFEIKFPIGMGGTQGGCLAFLVANNDKKNSSEGTLLSLVSRKASLFEIWVDDKQDFVDKIKFSKLNKSSGKVLMLWNGLRSRIDRNSKDKTIGINIGARNLGNVSHAISFSGKIHGLLGYKEIVDETKGILSYDDLDGVAIGKTGLSLPEYQGLFWINLNVSNALHFDFDSSSIPKEKLSKNSEHYTIVFFVFSVLSIGFWLIIILSVFMIYRIWRKKGGLNIDNLINRNIFGKLKKIFMKK